MSGDDLNSPPRGGVKGQKRYCEDHGEFFHMCRLCSLNAELRALREVAVQAQAASRTVSALGQAYRKDWSMFDGRQLRDELDDATSGLDQALAALDKVRSEER